MGSGHGQTLVRRPRHPAPADPHLSDGEALHADTCRPLVDAAGRGETQLHALARGQYPGRALPNDALPGLRSNGFWNVPEPADWGLPWHRNEGIEITFMDHGRHYFETDTFAGDLAPGQVTITRPWQPHRVGNPGLQPGRLYWMILDIGVRRPNQAWQWPRWVHLVEEDLDRLTTMPRHNERPVWPAPEPMRRCFEQIGRIVEHQPDRLSHLTVSLNPDYS